MSPRFILIVQSQSALVHDMFDFSASCLETIFDRTTSHARQNSISFVRQHCVPDVIGSKSSWALCMRGCVSPSCLSQFVLKKRAIDSAPSVKNHNTRLGPPAQHLLHPSSLSPADYRLYSSCLLLAPLLWYSQPFRHSNLSLHTVVQTSPLDRS